MRYRRSTFNNTSHLLLIVIFLLSACQAASPASTAAPSTATTRSADPTPRQGVAPAILKEDLKGLSVQVWYPWFGVEASLFESMVQAFNQTNEWGISVHATSQNSYTHLYDSITASLPTGERPQLAVGLPEYALAWDAGGYVADLTDYVDDAQYGLTSQDVSDFPAVFWSQDAIARRRLGIPAERSARLILYNRTWAQELGFSAAPRTASEFRDQACRAHQSTLADSDKTNDGQGGWLVDTNPMTFLSWIMAFGGGVLDGNGYSFLTPKNLAALTFVKQLYDDGCAWTAQPAADVPAAFARREALFATAGLEDLSDYARSMGSANNADEWTVLDFPGPAQAGLVIYGSSYIVLKSTREEQLASWLFIRWLLSPENQRKWVEATDLFPLRTSSLALLADYTKGHPQWSAAVDLLPQAQIQPQLASWREVRVMIGDGFDAMFRSNTPSGRVAEILAIMGTAAADLSK